MRIIDYFIDPIVYVAYFRKNLDKEQPSFELVKNRVRQFMDQNKTPPEGDSFTQKDFTLAHFAVCAWIDEAILTSTWKEKGKWQGEQLQLVYYDTAKAGKEFFDKLNQLTFDQKDVREVYTLCLTLGFRGQYHHEGDEYVLEPLITSHLQSMLGTSVGLPSLTRMELFPDAYPHETAELKPLTGRKQKTIYSVFALIFFSAPFVLFIILFFIYLFILDNKGDIILDMIV